MPHSSRRPHTVEVLLDAHRVADKNHRFYVDKRFTVISLYMPATTAILTAGYFLAPWQGRLVLAVLGVFIAFFMYSLEVRNWTLSVACLKQAESVSGEIARHCSDVPRASLDLHGCLARSHDEPLPPGYAPLDPLARSVARTQHRAVHWFTVVLLLYWGALAGAALCQGLRVALSAALAAFHEAHAVAI